MGEEGKACRSPICHAPAGQSPFRSALLRRGKELSVVGNGESKGSEEMVRDMRGRGFPEGLLLVLCVLLGIDSRR